MKVYTNWAFLRPVLQIWHLPLWCLYYRKPSFSMCLWSTQEHTIPICVKILQILSKLELSWFWIEGNGRFWDFLLFMYHCVVKSSVCSVPRYLQFVWKICMVKSESLNQLCISLHIYRIKLFSNFMSIAALTTRISCN